MKYLFVMLYLTFLSGRRTVNGYISTNQFIHRSYIFFFQFQGRAHNGSYPRATDGHVE